MKVTLLVPGMLISIFGVVIMFAGYIYYDILYPSLLMTFPVDSSLCCSVYHKMPFLFYAYPFISIAIILIGVVVIASSYFDETNGGED